MRNDARPIGEEARDKSPIDQREAADRNRQSDVVNRSEEERKTERSDTHHEDLEAEK